MKTRRSWRRVISAFLTLGIAVSGIAWQPAYIQNKVFAATDLKTAVSNSNDFSEYKKKHLNFSSAQQKNIVLTADHVTAKDSHTEIQTDDEQLGKKVAIDAQGYATWSFSVENAAWYAIKIKYKALPYQENSAMASVTVDGVLPYQEMKSLTFPRIWQDIVKNGNFQTDNRGNEIVPESLDLVDWQVMTLRDTSGFYDTPLLLALAAGTHTLTLTMEKEMMAVAEITLYTYEPDKTYSQVYQEYSSQQLKRADVGSLLLEAEYPSAKSDFTLTPIYDRSSPKTSPQSVSSICLNTIGGTRWETEGQWIEWTVNVPEDGLYKISTRFRQNIIEGLFVSRRLTIDGTVPFKEAEKLRFPYSGNWQAGFLGDGKQDYWFYLKEGKRTLRLECTLGEMASTVDELDSCVLELNAIYREILAVTGPTPDNYRDYDFPTVIPETLNKMQALSEHLDNLVSQVQALNGVKGELISVAARASQLLKQLAKKPARIAKSFSQLKDNAGSLGSAVQSMRLQPLELDQIALTSGDQPLSADVGFLGNAWHQICLFGASFISDYSAMGNADQKKKNLKVWIATGRDQASIINNLIYSRMDANSPYGVSLELVATNALLPATLAGIGPDVSISNALTDPINFAIRGGVLDLTQFEDYSKVITRFSPSALIPLSYNGALYALPETQSFPMMFYRTDILEEKNLKVPKTWDDLIALIPKLSNDNMEFGFLQGINGLLLLMVQQNIPLYRENGLYTNLDSDGAMGCFQQLCELYTLYKLPVAYDFANRFRTGEMPVGIADFTMYNQLTVFAPEIQGLWQMAMVPGTLQEDGTVNQSVNSTGLACMILHGTKNADYAWDFLKWWTSPEIQKNYALDMEGILGAAAKQPVASLEAFQSLSWDNATYKMLQEQRKQVVGIPEVPGGYIVSRNITFAFNNVVESNTKPTDTLMGYIYSINTELYRKQREFGLVS